MARVEFGPNWMHLRGGAGNSVYRKVDGRTILSARPQREDRPPTEKEQANQERFRKAVKYARRALKNAEFRPVYEAIAGAERKPLFSMANRDALIKPVVDEIDRSAYGGAPGDVIAIAASDDTGVVHVGVELRDGDDHVFETGAAELDASGWWLYAAQNSVPEGAFVHIEVIAVDRPGGKGGASAGTVVSRVASASDRPRRRKPPGRGRGPVSSGPRNDGLTSDSVSPQVIASPRSPATAFPLPAPTTDLLDGARLLRTARVCAGISQRELARRAGISQSVVSRIEKGLTSPTVETLLRLLYSAGFEVVAELRSTEGRHVR